MHLDILIDMKLLLCSVSSPGIAFLINRKLLLCSATSPRIALAILAKQSAGFAFLIGLRCQRVFYPNRKLLIGSINFSIPAGGKQYEKKNVELYGNAEACHPFY